MIWTILLKKEFLIAMFGVLTTILGMLNLPGLAGLFSDPAFQASVSNIVAAIGVLITGGGTAAAVVAEKPPELQ